MILIPIIIMIGAGCLKPSLALSDILHDHPWVGSMSFLESPGMKHHCNTILVTTEKAITAGHCILLEPHLNQTKQIPWHKYPAFVVMGVEDYMDSCNKNFQKAKVASAHLWGNASYGHPYPFENRFDMAILKLEPGLYGGSQPYFTVNTWNPFLDEKSYEERMQVVLEKELWAGCGAIGWELHPHEPPGRYPANRSKLDSYHIQFHSNAVACGKFMGSKHKEQCFKFMGFWNRYPFTAIGGMARGAAGASVVCYVGKTSYLFAMVSGSISGCHGYQCGNSSLQPVLVGGIDHENLKMLSNWL